MQRAFEGIQVLFKKPKWDQGDRLEVKADMLPAPDPSLIPATP